MPGTRALIFVGAYVPGSKAGGPIRSVSNLVESLGDEIEFRVVTSDRDLGDTRPYAGVTTDQWVAVGKAQVMYLSPGNRGLRALGRLIRETPHDVLYLNSFFCDHFTIRPLLLRRLGLIPKVRTIVAPRGEFAWGALAQKALKKRVYRVMAHMIGLYHDVTWQASSAAEKSDVRRAEGPRVRVMVAPVVLAPDISTAPDGPDGASNGASPAVPGSSRLVTVSRISRVKNLHWLGEVLQGVRGEVSLDLYGLIEDPAYWETCQKAFASLPTNVRVEHRGAVSHDDIQRVLSGYDLFVLPTLGENFGHAIAEALAAGVPALISDQTPWRGLAAARAGWDLPLDDATAFRDAVQAVVDMDETELQQWRDGARRFLASHPLVTEAVEANRRLFLGY